MVNVTFGHCSTSLFDSVIDSGIQFVGEWFRNKENGLLNDTLEFGRSQRLCLEKMFLQFQLSQLPGRGRGGKGLSYEKGGDARRLA